jgi:hypothetical protein
MTQDTTHPGPELTKAIFEYATQMMPPKPVNLLVIGGDIAESQKLADSVFGSRLSGSRFMLSLKGYAHGNTKKPPAGSLDLVIIDARDHDLSKLTDGFLLALEAVAPRGRIACIAPSDILAGEETQSFRHILTERCSVIHVHQNPDETDASVLWIGNATPSIKQAVVLSHGGAPTKPNKFVNLPINTVRNAADWKALLPQSEGISGGSSDLLSNYFDIRRGVTTGADDFFVLPVTEIEKMGLEAEAFRPVLPDPVELQDEVIEARPGGFPDTDEKLAILQIPETEQVEERFPNVAAYLATGVARGLDKQFEATRSPWFSLETPTVAPIVIAAREGQPCCFFLNRTTAIATDKYLALYPKERVAAALATNNTLVSRIWSAITAAIEVADESVTVNDLPKFEVPGLSKILPN